MYPRWHVLQPRAKRAGVWGEALESRCTEPRGQQTSGTEGARARSGSMRVHGSARGGGHRMRGLTRNTGMTDDRVQHSGGRNSGNAQNALALPGHTLSGIPWAGTGGSTQHARPSPGCLTLSPLLGQRGGPGGKGRRAIGRPEPGSVSHCHNKHLLKESDVSILARPNSQLCVCGWKGPWLRRQ